MCICVYNVLCVYVYLSLSLSPSLSLSIYIYIHIIVIVICTQIARHASRGREDKGTHGPLSFTRSPNLPTNTVGFRGFDSSIMLSRRGGIPRPIGNFPESLSQAMLVGCNVSRGIGRMSPFMCGF